VTPNLQTFLGALFSEIAYVARAWVAVTVVTSSNLAAGRVVSESVQIGNGANHYTIQIEVTQKLESLS
jgi:hypothetical protein